MDAKININSPQQMQEFMLNEANMIKEMIDHIVESEAKVVFCGKNIDESAQHFLAKEGILAIQRLANEVYAIQEAIRNGEYDETLETLTLTL
jgi:chaperonin GroEL (HSP60 family)